MEIKRDSGDNACHVYKQVVTDCVCDNEGYASSYSRYGN